MSTKNEEHLPNATEEEERAAKRRARRDLILAEQTAVATAEIDAMRQVFIIIHPLGEDAAKRIIRWVAERISDLPNPNYYFDEVPF